MFRRLASVITASAALASLVGCGSGEKIKAATEAATHEGEKPTVTVAFSHLTDDPLARFAVAVTNPDDKTRTGIKVTWKALDADGVIVGTHDNEIQPIAPGATTYYVGGAGGANLTGVPAKVEVEVTDDGEVVKKQEPSGVTVEKVEFKKADFNMTDARTFNVSVVLTATRDLKAADVDTNFVLLNKEGKVIGAAWGDETGLPADIAKGDKFRVATTVDVYNGTPVKAEAYAWE